jgi:2'-5' RNA ligase
MRLFIAADLSDAQTSALAAKVDEAKQAAPFEAIRWLPSENWHGTLAFLGDRDAESVSSMIDLISPVLEEAGKLDYRPMRIQCMPHRSMPRLLALKTLAGQGLQELYFHLHNALGIRDRKHQFQFHVTVARFKEVRGDDARALTDAIKDLSSLEGEEWVAPSVTLFQSELNQAGATYKVVQTWPARSVD